MAKIIWSRSWLVVAALVLAPASALAQAQPQEATHDGFYLRMATGGGYGSASFGEAQAETSIKSATWMLDVTPGYFVTRNLEVGGNFFLASEVSPSVSVGGMDVGSGLSSSFDLFSFGAAATYYFDQFNLFAGGSAGIAWVHQADTSDAGVALNVLGGKEWQVSPHWGLGLAANFYYAHTSYAGVGINSLGGGLNFSAAYTARQGL
jgi:hypothetical protein